MNENHYRIIFIWCCTAEGRFRMKQESCQYGESGSKGGGDFLKCRYARKGKKINAYWWIRSCLLVMSGWMVIVMWRIETIHLNQKVRICVKNPVQWWEPKREEEVYSYVFPKLISIRIFLSLSWPGHIVRIFCAYRRALSLKAFVPRVDHHFKERMQSWMWLSTNGRYVIRSNRWSIMAGKTWNRKTGITRSILFSRFLVRSVTVSAGIPGW